MTCSGCQRESESDPCGGCMAKADGMAREFGMKVMSAIEKIKDGYRVAGFTITTDTLGTLNVTVTRQTWR